MKKELFLNSKITFTDPYVIRLQCADPYNSVDTGVNFRETLVRAKKIYTGATWAYSNPDWQTISLPADQHIKMHNSWYTNTTRQELHSYWAFKDDQDALQFRLSIGEAAKQVLIWPAKVRFTVYQYTDE